jgi:hypothetical protein
LFFLLISVRYIFLMEMNLRTEGFRRSKGLLKKIFFCLLGETKKLWCHVWGKTYKLEGVYFFIGTMVIFLTKKSSGFLFGVFGLVWGNLGLRRKKICVLSMFKEKKMKGNERNGNGQE